MTIGLRRAEPLTRLQVAESTGHLQGFAQVTLGGADAAAGIQGT